MIWSITRSQSYALGGKAYNKTSEYQIPAKPPLHPPPPQKKRYIIPHYRNLHPISVLFRNKRQMMFRRTLCTRALDNRRQYITPNKSRRTWSPSLTNHRLYMRDNDPPIRPQQLISGKAEMLQSERTV